jgi:hypothetical protein
MSRAVVGGAPSLGEAPTHLCRGPGDCDERGLRFVELDPATDGVTPTQTGSAQRRVGRLDRQRPTSGQPQQPTHRVGGQVRQAAAGTVPA